MRWWPFTRRREALRARISAEIDAGIARQRELRLKRAEAARKGHATKLHNAYCRDALLNEQVQF